MDSLNIETFLKFGSLGLCALILVLFWRILSKEQSRDGEPRPGIMKLSGAFMGLAFILAGVAAFVEVHKQGSANAKSLQAELNALRNAQAHDQAEIASCRATVDGKDDQIDLLTSLLEGANAEAKKIEGNVEAKERILKLTSRDQLLGASQLKSSELLRVDPNLIKRSETLAPQRGK